jgi:Amyotrophic lateral sclerosis 2 chromosomal region candidate gene 8
VWECKFGSKKRYESDARKASAPYGTTKVGCKARVAVTEKRDLAGGEGKTFFELKIFPSEVKCHSFFFTNAFFNSEHENHIIGSVVDLAKLPINPAVLLCIEDWINSGVTSIPLLLRRIRQFVRNDLKLANIEDSDRRYIPTQNDLRNLIKLHTIRKRLALLDLDAVEEWCRQRKVGRLVKKVFPVTKCSL